MSLLSVNDSNSFVQVAMTPGDWGGQTLIWGPHVPMSEVYTGSEIPFHRDFRVPKTTQEKSKHVIFEEPVFQRGPNMEEQGDLI